MNHGTLISHVDTDIVTRAQLLAVPTPEQTAWSLQNAFTGAAKEMPMPTRMNAIQGVGKLFGMSNEAEKAPLLIPATEAA